MKVIVSDFDETFYNPSYASYEENLLKIKEFTQKGNLFVIATGRNIETLKSDIIWENIPFSYLICNDGATIYNQNYELIKETTLKQKVISPIFHYFDRRKKFTEVWMDYHGEHTVDTSLPAHKIIVGYTDFKTAKQALDTICKKYPEVTGYLDERWIHFVDCHVDKGKAVQELSMQEGWSSDIIYAIGDSMNDLSLLTMFRGCTLKWAALDLKQVSIKIVDSFTAFVDMVLADDNVL